ncbi:MAG TPA: ATP-binding protein, partial [Bdellovibrionota bacterium]|nr:ATP-binding protein [Bdellovibrionota bacterium]
VAHELNNPIGYIYSNISHLRKDMDQIRQLLKEYEQAETQLPEDLRDEMKNLKAQLDIRFTLGDIDNIITSCLEGASRTKDIVTGLRNFSRLDEAEIKTVDLHEGLDTTIKLLRSEFKDRITLHKDYGDLPFVTCHPSQINQVFMNILTNAAQAISGQGNIWIKTRREGNDVVMSFKDDGPGVKPEHLDRIFEPFFTLKPIGKGTGLGLSISYGIIEKHHGNIKVESQVGKGTTFTIRLPIKAA